MKKTIDLLLDIFKLNEDLSNYAFSLYCFIEKLNTELKEKEITDVYFLAREGKFLKLLYDILNASNSKKIATHYMYISRKAIINATLEDLEHESFQAFRVYKKISPVKFLQSMNFNEEEIKLVFSADSSVDDECENFFQSKLFYDLKQNGTFITLYEKKRHAMHCNLEKYLKSIGFIDAKKVAIVDVGWNGTIQNGLFKTKLHDNIYGYYIGCTDDDIQSGNMKSGLLFSSHSKYLFFDPFYYKRYYFELICVADHGGTDHYDENGQPVLITDDDNALYEQYFHDIQDSTLAKFKKIDKTMKENPCRSAQMEYYIKYLHARMLLTLKKRNRGVIQYAAQNHPDNFINIKFQYNFKARLYATLQPIAITISAAIYWILSKI